MSNLVSLTCPSLLILSKTQTGISNFWISGQSFVREDCSNTKTDNDINMKLKPETKLDKRNTATSKKSDGDILLANCDIIVIFPIYG